jgi:hypothetical protein
MAFDSTGKKLYDKQSFGKSPYEKGTAIVVAPDGIVLSGLNHRKPGSIYGYMEKIDFQGNTVWDKSYPT